MLIIAVPVSIPDVSPALYGVLSVSLLHLTIRRAVRPMSAIGNRSATGSRSPKSLHRQNSTIIINMPKFVY